MTNVVAGPTHCRKIVGTINWIVSWIVTLFAFLVSAINIVLYARILPDLWLQFLLQNVWLVLILTSPFLIRRAMRSDSDGTFQASPRGTTLRASSGVVFGVGAVMFFIIGVLLHSSIY